MTSGHRTVLFLAGTGTLLIALLHLVVILVGAPAYSYFGAPRLALLTEQGSNFPALVTAGIAFVFFVWAAYAFVGAGLVYWRLPVVRAALIAIGAIYTLRGLVLVPDLIRVARGAGNPFRQTVFSAISLALGVLYLVGSAARAEEPPAQAF